MRSMPTRLVRPEVLDSQKQRSVVYARRGEVRPVPIGASHDVAEPLRKVLQWNRLGDRSAAHVMFANANRDPLGRARIPQAGFEMRGVVLLALDGFPKKQQELPTRHLDLAKRRLADWRRRARG